MPLNIEVVNASGSVAISIGELVPRGGIEPPTRGFSADVLAEFTIRSRSCSRKTECAKKCAKKLVQFRSCLYRRMNLVLLSISHITLSWLDIPKPGSPALAVYDHEEITES